MITTVVVKARCSADAQIRVTCNGTTLFTLQNGESCECSVFEDRVISVAEERKPRPAPACVAVLKRA